MYSCKLEPRAHYTALLLDCVIFASHSQGSAWLWKAGSLMASVILSTVPSAGSLTDDPWTDRWASMNRWKTFGVGLAGQGSAVVSSLGQIQIPFWNISKAISSIFTETSVVCVHGSMPNCSLPNTVIHLFVSYTPFDFSHIWPWLRTPSIWCTWLGSQIS